MPYNVYTYENVSIGACSVKSALDDLNDDEKKEQFLDNINIIEEARSFRSISRPSIASLGSAAGPIGFAKQ